MKITFVLPAYARIPVGGYKVVYEYANRLQEKGYQLTIVHPRYLKLPKNPLRQLKGQLWPSKMHLFEGSLVPWFSINPAVRLMLVPSLDPKYIPNADVIVATNWQTAEQVQYYSPIKGHKKYLVYDYEHWASATGEVRKRMSKTYRDDIFNLIATSPSVKLMLEENGAKPAAYIPCGIDLNTYHVEVPINKRVPGTIGFPVRKAEYKGSADALAALKLLKQNYRDVVQVSAFGPEPETNLPEWIDYKCLPSDEELGRFYNSLSIFMLPSHYEGWGLPAVEAMACGAALVAADSIGINDFAKDRETALIVHRKRPDLLATAVEELLRNDDLRQQLAQNGEIAAHKYTWKVAVEAMERELLG